MVMIQNLCFRIGILRYSKWLGIGWWDGDVPDGGGQVWDVMVVKMMVTYPLLRVPMPRTPGCEQRRLSDNTHAGRGGGVESVKPIIAEDINMVDNKPGSPPANGHVTPHCVGQALQHRQT